ncbi:AMP dependent CoA ligase, putative [Talaromyces stipitatus ATCC 10500]|uniref:AMP dependent CoA ligase, putative n=1 Tax=Talaromyces stipitatus (strain ATCC 10500 / CBS 375.48 / QM 6759 / NRRL 1006) TaxID=441959 RepID=B8MQC0_TALSN|nr:AMP dependent CoA ligase, putative [Talaromyces stipitatus ATCC 10500]EED13322.1 AMP dependent CoA ligase, putative [Talaromyces stipitatus ATCC 10500]
MMWLNSIILLAMFTSPLRNLLLDLLSWRREQNVDKTGSEDYLSEVSGGVWEHSLVFVHIEQGLKKNPDGSAVISTFQSVDALPYLLSGESRVLDLDTTTITQKVSFTKISAVSPFQHGTFSPLQYGAFTQPTRFEKKIDKPKPVIQEKQKPHISSQYLTILYSQLHRTSLKLAAGMIANGVKPDSKLLMIIPNGGEYTLLLRACILLRVTYVSLDPEVLDISGFTTLKATIQALKPQVVVTPDAITGKSIDVAISELRLPKPIKICLSSSRFGHWRPLAELVHETLKCPIDEEALVAAARNDNPNRIHSIIFTSGTSGMPKGCPVRISNMSHMLHSQSWLVDEVNGTLALQQAHNSRGIAPAQTMQTWKAGGAVVMTGQEFNVRKALDAIINLHITFIVLTPPMIHEIIAKLTANPVDISSVKRVQVGGDAITKGLLLKTASLSPKAQVCVNHGMTEGGGSFIIPFFGEICPIGVVAPGATIRVCDTEKNCIVKKCQFGELHITSGSLIKHYFGGRSEASFYCDHGVRWFNTGDVAMVNEDGLVSILGRQKDMIKRAGVAIMPAALESSIAAFIGSQTIVVPIRHPIVGYEPFAALNSNNGKTQDQIKEHVRIAFGKDYALGGIVSLKELGLL